MYNLNTLNELKSQPGVFILMRSPLVEELIFLLFLYTFENANKLKTKISEWK